MSSLSMGAGKVDAGEIYRYDGGASWTKLS